MFFLLSMFIASASPRNPALDVVSVHLPFSADDAVKCISAPRPPYGADDSRQFTVVFDSPDGEDDGSVYAPVMGQAYAHFDEVDGGLAHHVKIDLRDGSYILVARLSEAAVLSGEYVLVGTRIGFEGIEGIHNGSDVLVGRFFGDPREGSADDPSMNTLLFFVHDRSLGWGGVVPMHKLRCDARYGRVYASRIEVAPTKEWQMPPPDDLNEQLSWLRVYGENVGMASHDQDDFSWHAFPEGDYRVAIDDSYAEHCASADQTSALCRDGEDGWALCINSSDGDILPLAEAACDRLE